ncbi:nitroreductase [Candidatus Acetothermia bacterium]|nr:MAG: nitroreductase [Candidatus Acetothermia bacterium]
MREKTGEEFMQNTFYRNMGRSDQEKGLPQPPLELPSEQGERINLPAPSALSLGATPLNDVIAARRSLRRYSPAPLTLEELSFLLWCTQGVKKVVPGRATFRTVPSAGARHPFETYLLINRVQGLSPGIYRFLAIDHQLVQLETTPGITDRVVAVCLDQEFIKQSAATFFWVAVPYRTTWRYGARGYRYLHLDAGHVCQNLYLAATTIDAGACAIGAFLDEELNALFGLDGVTRFIIYLATVGKRPE